MIKPIKVLITDDSVFFSQQLKELLESDPLVQVVGIASNGGESVEKVLDLKPDIITMDIEMPLMGGLDAIEKIMGVTPTPILVLSEYTNAKSSFEALNKGALEVVSKSEIDLENPEVILGKIKLLSQIKVITHVRGKLSDKRKDLGSSKSLEKKSFNKVVLIASSTGGPKTLSSILERLDNDFSMPIVIAQHMSEGFIEGMAEWLDSVTDLKVKVAENGETIKIGYAYVSPVLENLTVTSDLKLKLLSGEPDAIYRPSCNMLLDSGALSLGSNAVGLILTGMGSDGALGMEKIKSRGGVTIAQDESSSAIFSMPQSAIERGSVDYVLGLDGIVERLNLLSSESFNGK